MLSSVKLLLLICSLGRKKDICVVCSISNVSTFFCCTEMKVVLSLSSSFAYWKTSRKTFKKCGFMCGIKVFRRSKFYVHTRRINLCECLSCECLISFDILSMCVSYVLLNSISIWLVCLVNQGLKTKFFWKSLRVNVFSIKWNESHWKWLRHTQIHNNNNNQEVWQTAPQVDSSKPMVIIKTTILHAL